MAAEQLLPTLERRLEALRAQRPDLEPALRLQGDLLRAVLAVPGEPEIARFPLPLERAQAKLEAGVPLLNSEPAYVDAVYAGRIFRGLLDAVAATATDETAEAIADIRGALGDGRLNLDHLMDEAFVQHHDHVWEMANLYGLLPQALDSLATQAVGPLLAAYGTALGPIVTRAGGQSWARGYCPVCGAWPLLQELRGVERHPYLRCLACGTGWHWARALCPYCLNDDAERLKVIEIRSERRFSVQACDACGGYIKAANAFEPSPTPLLPLDDLASMALDGVAVEHGFHRPEGSGFRLDLTLPEEEWAEDLASLD